MVFKKKLYFILGLLAGIIALSVLGNTYIPKLEISSDYADKPQIILDAGHQELLNTININKV